MGTGVHPRADLLLLLLVTHVCSFCTPTCLPVCHLDLASTWSQQVVRAHQIKSFVAQRCSSCAATCLATGSPSQTAAGRTCRPRCLVLPLPMRGTRCPGRRQRPARWAAWSPWRGEAIAAAGTAVRGLWSASRSVTPIPRFFKPFWVLNMVADCRHQRLSSLLLAETLHAKHLHCSIYNVLSKPNHANCFRHGCNTRHLSWLATINIPLCQYAKAVRVLNCRCYQWLWVNARCQEHTPLQPQA